jgi:hypothetical protein
MNPFNLSNQISGKLKVDKKLESDFKANFNINVMKLSKLNGLNLSICNLPKRAAKLLKTKGFS